jgi:hypothetical protein
MSHFTLAASGLVIDAFQWLGGDLASYSMPPWIQNMQLTTPGDGTVCLPTYMGNMPANPTDWVARGPGGNVFIMPNVLFSALFAPTA